MAQYISNFASGLLGSVAGNALNSLLPNGESNSFFSTDFLSKQVSQALDDNGERISDTIESGVEKGVQEGGRTVLKEFYLFVAAYSVFSLLVKYLK